MTNNSDGRATAYLKERGITMETVSDNKVELCAKLQPRDYRLRLRFDQWNGGPLHEIVEESIWFPCMDANTTIRSWIMRSLPALPAKDKDNGSEVKFLSPRGEPSYPFIPAATWAVKDKAKIPLLITEGPCKALAALQAGAFPIAGSGVWMMTAKANEAGTTRLHPALTENFLFRGRIVYVAFDADFALNPSVRQALIRTAILLHKTGADVKILRWPLKDGKGLDDFLAKSNSRNQTAAQAFELLCKGACDLGGVLSLCDLEFFELEAGRARLKGSVLAQLCKMVSKSLGVSAETLKEGIRAEYEEQEQATGMTDPDPWPEPVDGMKLADEIAEVLRRHVVMTQQKTNAIALWIFLTYLEAAVDCLPILAIRSPEKRCGKTTLLDVLGRLVSKPLQSSNCSVAAIYRVIEKFHPTLLIDEVDTWLKDNEEARGVINSGHTRGSAYVLRCNKDSGEPEHFSTWSPKVLAGIGRLSDTLVDRSITIQLERRTAKDTATKLRDVDPAQFHRIRQQLIRWAADHIEEIKEARPALPATLNDREGDNWFPLLAIAEQIGGQWKAKADAAALALSSSDDAESIPTQLLVALKGIYDQFPKEDFLPTSQIIEELNEEKDSPWADWNKGKGISEMKLAQILRQFGVRSERPTIGKKKVSGYYRKDLKPVFDRYVHTPPPVTPKK